MSTDHEMIALLSESAGRYVSDHYGFLKRRAVLDDPDGYSAKAWHDYLPTITVRAKPRSSRLCCPANGWKQRFTNRSRALRVPELTRSVELPRGASSRDPNSQKQKAGYCKKGG